MKSLWSVEVGYGDGYEIFIKEGAVRYLCKVFKFKVCKRMIESFCRLKSELNSLWNVFNVLECIRY